jgi:predicted DNA-binding ribbon-helix-helix protein
VQYAARLLMNALFAHVQQGDFILTSPTDRTIIKRSVVLDGRKTSVSLETGFWEPLKQIAGREGISISRLIERVGNGAGAKQNLSSALRVFVLQYVRQHGDPSPQDQAPI